MLTLSRALGVSFALLVTPLRAATVPVSDCTNVVVNRGDTAVLQNDIVCATDPLGHPGGSIFLDRGATLVLNGHGISHHAALSPSAAVQCASRCRVLGPGTIASDNAAAGIRIDGVGGRATVRDLTISGVWSGIMGLDARVMLANSSITAFQWGIATVRRAKVEHLSVATSVLGGYCIGATAESGSVVEGRDVTLTGCDSGIWASDRVRVSNLTIAGANGIGVYGRRRVVLTNSSVTASGQVDIASQRRPQLANSTCERSGVDTGDVFTSSWGVCAND